MTNVNEQPKTQKSATKKSNGAKMLWVGALLTVAAAAVIIFWATRKTSQASANMGFFTVRRDNLTVTVSQSGSIRAHKSQQYKCQVQSRGSASGVTILSIVQPGKVITQEDVDNGLVLVQLDSSSLEDRLVTERMNLATASDTETSAKEAYDIQIIDNESSIADSQLRVRFALLDLQKYLGEDLANRLVKDINGISANLTKYVAPFVDEVKKDPNILAGCSAWQQWKRLQDDIVLAEGNLKTQQQTLTGTEKLFDANFVSVLDLDRDRLTLKNRQFSLESAKLSLTLFLDYDFPKNAEQYLSNYVEAQRGYQRTLASCRSRLAQASSRLNTAKTRYDEQEANVKDLEQQVAYCTIKAKSPGLVLYGTGGAEDQMRAMMGRGGGGSSRMIEVGETVTEGQVLISIPDTSAWIAEVSIHETEVEKVRVGQPAVIVMDVAPDKTLQGEVLSVASFPDQQRGMMNPDLKVYKTLVRLDGTENAGFLKSQMSCRVEILVGKAENSLIVPITSVANRGGKKVCYVINSQGSSEEQEVKAGLFNDKYVEILEGLEEGDKVLLNPPLITEIVTTTADVFEGVDALPMENINSGGQNRGSGVGNRGGLGGGQRGTMRGQGGTGMGTGMSGFNPDQMPQMPMNGTAGQPGSMRGFSRGAGTGMGGGTRGSGGGNEASSGAATGGND